MIVTHTFLDKSNTIIEGSKANTGLNPIMSLYYGNLHTRVLIHFNTDNLKQLVNDKTYPDITKLKHILKFWNVADVDIPRINCKFPDQDRSGVRERAVSFELILFTLPKKWDAGRGFDFVEDDVNESGKRAYSEYASNWYYNKSNEKWDEPGVYSVDFLEEEYNNPESEIIVGRQSFDFGNEQFEMDITEIVNKYLTGEIENNGLGIAFAPSFEKSKDTVSQYVGFFGNRTNTFFEPYLETRYEETIQDDRLNFFLDKSNKLYFYSTIGGKSVNLDVLPTCTINGKELEVKQSTKGVYYADVILSSTDNQPNTMIYDTWSNIVYKGVKYPNVELSTTTKSSEGYMSLGLPFNTEKQPKFKPSIYGINEGENIKQGDVRKINVDCKINYTTNQIFPLQSLEYRLYVKTADRQVDVINWTECDVVYDSSCFYINTNELLPQTYYVDIKAKYNQEEIINREMLSFNIVNDGRKPE